MTLLVALCPREGRTLLACPSTSGDKQAGGALVLLTAGQGGVAALQALLTELGADGSWLGF